MKKIFLIIVLCFLILGCANLNQTQSKNESPRNDKNDDEIIEEIKDKMESHPPKKVYEIINDNFDKVDTKENKNKIIDLYNDFILDYIEPDLDSSMANTNFFIDKDTKKINNDKYLTDDTKEKIIEKGNPVYTELEKLNLNIELSPEYNEVIKAEKGITTVIEWMNDNNVDFNSISDDMSGLIALSDNTVIEFTQYKIRRIFKITDDDSEVQDPHSVLSELGTEMASDEYERQEENLGETEVVDLEKESEDDKEKEPTKKDKPISIGMTAEEVLEIKGEPKDINRTRNAYGTEEQWVYYSSYLYFEDGILTTIQD